MADKSNEVAKVCTTPTAEKMINDLKAPERPMWCDACRSTGTFHCAHPDECGNMLSAAGAADNWKAWLDDIPLNSIFDPAICRLQDFISALVARIADLEAALADMTRQRDAAMAGVVKVKPLVFSPWSGGGCMGSPQPFQFFITQMQDQNGDFLCHWDSSTYKTLDEAKAHAQACYLPPDPDRMLALTAAAYEDAAQHARCQFDDRGNSRAGHYSEMDWTDGYAAACGAAADRIRALTDALAALSRIEAQAEARGCGRQLK